MTVAAYVSPVAVRGADGAVLYEGPTPLHWCIQDGPAGDVHVEPGVYRVPKIVRTNGGRYIAVGRATITPEQVDGSRGSYTLYLEQGNEGRPLFFHGFDIPPGETCAFTTYAKNGPYEVSFVDCLIDGGYDHSTETGTMSKWGMIPHVWSGSLIDCTIRNIAKEHAAYPHSISGDVLVRGCRFEGLGRTALQFASRDTEDGYSPYRVTIRDCTIDDVGLNDGGSAITAYGIKELVIRGVKSRIGWREDFREQWKAYHPGRIFGTGHLAVWEDNGRAQELDGVWLHDYVASSAPGCGSAPSLLLRHQKAVLVSGALHVDAGVYGSAIEADVVPRWDELTYLKLNGSVSLGAPEGAP